VLSEQQLRRFKTKRMLKGERTVEIQIDQIDVSLIKLFLSKNEMIFIEKIILAGKKMDNWTS